eukprot:NODE_4899_length_440_cov_130.818414_g4239_i0.p1 GENE.NODE_4899_length_440_cov_130.818414_g4239_i0~~NODE_4899_length_440_cov_130.818414_g4239_i0.p1  ORF type:complete len:105 (+),score=19.75 NODE_4899_length_440_cov_130.818414_g4239_i0:34-348(+)
MGAIFPKVQVPDPSAFYITRWGLDPLAYGCYSGVQIGFKDKWMWTLTRPLKVNHTARVYFAGEAMCDDISGTTYGAHQSGLQTAQHYLHKTGRQPKAPLDLCNL